MIHSIDPLLQYIKAQIKEFTDCAVVGMSGGADSTLVTLLAVSALGAENVYTLHMPMNEFDTTKFNANSTAIAKSLGVHRYWLPIHSIVEQIIAGLQPVCQQLQSELTPLNMGNSRSRARMTLLYGASRHIEETLQRRTRVLGTGNFSEDYIGYDTKGGDALSDLFPIGELYKSEVYQFLEYFRDLGWIKEEWIDRVPSAGLWHGQTDEEELGYSYDVMEQGIRRVLQQPPVGELNEVEKFVLDRHNVHKHKHEAPRVLSLRTFCD